MQAPPAGEGAAAPEAPPADAAASKPEAAAPAEAAASKPVEGSEKGEKDESVAAVGKAGAAAGGSPAAEGSSAAAPPSSLFGSSFGASNGSGFAGFAGLAGKPFSLRVWGFRFRVRISRTENSLTMTPLDRLTGV